MIQEKARNISLAILAIVLPSFRALHDQVDAPDFTLNQDGSDPDDVEGDGTGATCRS
jgi:hypothetical protein